MPVIKREYVAKLAMTAYIAKAIALTGDALELNQIRSGIRNKVQASPLCDAQRFAQSFAEIVRMAWAESVVQAA